MIPEHRNGRLPEGIHAASWAEVVERFATNARRRRLVQGLHEALSHLASVGCQRVYLAGSFVTTKELPKDIDVCWDVDGVDADEIHPMFLDMFTGRQMTLALFGAEFFPATIIEGVSGETFLEFFQTARDGQRVGIVAVDLETL